MSSLTTTIEGLTVIVTPMGDIKVTIHHADLLQSLSAIPAQPNGISVAVATKRLLPSVGGHTHAKPRVVKFKECARSKEKSGT